MTGVNAAAMLLAHLQIRAPDARIVVLAPPRSGTGSSTLARELAALPAMPAGASVDLSTLSSAEIWTVAEARTVLSVPERRTFVAVGGVLERPDALVAAAAADAVVVVVTRGHTERSDLTRVKDELDSVGAHLIGAVLLN